jgi:hypothetical protein
MPLGTMTAYARLAALKHAIPGQTPTPRPTAFHVALYSGSADPAGSPAEIAVAGYARQPVLLGPYGPENVANNFDTVDFSAMAGATVGGVAILDAASGGNVYYWWDLDAPLAAADGLTIPSGQLTVTTQVYPTSTYGQWSLPAAASALAYITPGVTPPAAPTAYWAALFTSSADPAGTPVEAAVAGYSRKAVALAPDGTLRYSNNANVLWPVMTALLVKGVALMDAATGGAAWAWWDLATPLLAAGGMRLEAGHLSIDMAGSL